MALLFVILLAQIEGTGRNWSAPHRDNRNGMQSVMYCGNSPSSYVRASGSLDTASGRITIAAQLETDSVAAGPKGRITATIKDASGSILATVQSEEVGIGGKAPGKARVENFSSRIDVDPALAQRAASLFIEAQCTGSTDRLFGIRVGTLTDAFKLVLMVP